MIRRSDTMGWRLPSSSFFVRIFAAFLFWFLLWFSCFLAFLFTNRSQFALIEGCRSQSCELKCGVPQGSVLAGPILYVFYTAPLANILRIHEMQFHFYDNDTQLYISFSTNNDMELTNSISMIEECLSDIDKWMSISRPKLNKDKTELLYQFSKYNPQQSLPPLRFETGAQFNKRIVNGDLKWLARMF